MSEFVTVSTVVDMSLSYLERVKAHHHINKHFTGTKEIPLHIKCSEEHKEAAWNMCAVRRKKVLIDIDTAGNWCNIRFAP